MSGKEDSATRVTPFSSDDCCGESGGSEEDLVTDYLGEERVAGPQLPTISVTPHSPAGKHYPVLEENLQQLHYMREFILRISQDCLGQEQARMTASCPSLNEAAVEAEASSVGSTPSGTLAPRRAWQPGEVSRRRSWAAAEELARPLQRHACSASLSSVESDAEDEALRRAPVVSTHSLTDDDPAAARPVRLRLCSPLQKSVSTPSMLAGELAPVAAPPLESDDDEMLSALLGAKPEKRRKRGSLFFRKKKDKLKKAHQWVAVCYAYTQNCEACSKTLSNKPSVICENCNIAVHQKCKDSANDCKGKQGKNLTKANKKKGCNSPMGDEEVCHDAISYSDAAPLVQYEFLDELPLTVADLDADPMLGLHDNEPDSWAPTVSREVLKKIKEKEIKRQEHIYEFVMTEKHHCLTLKVVQKIFVEGLKKHSHLGPNVEKLFPRLADLTDIHINFLHRLRARQRKGHLVDSLGDILLEQFSGDHADRLMSVYGEFCSNHRNAIDLYKYYMQHDRRFSEFVKHCQSNPLLKKKGIPECILFVTQRLTKYPLLIEPLIKTSKEDKDEHDRLTRALSLIKEILTEVDSQVAEREKEDRKLEIYNKIEAKSFTTFRGTKFKKSDLLVTGRKLKFEGVAMLMQGRGKMQVVLDVVLSDVLCFLLESNQKYSFFTPDSKAGVVALQKLLVREKAGQDSRGIYLISSNPSDPEMFELRVHKPKDKKSWINAIRAAVEECPEEEEEERGETDQGQVRDLMELLKAKEREAAQVLEEKAALQGRLLAACGVDARPVPASELWAIVERASTVARSLLPAALARSASSVGETTGRPAAPAALPRRAETFGGYDQGRREKPATTDATGELAETSLALCRIVSQQQAAIDALTAELSRAQDSRPLYRHNQQLEELRNLQDRLTSERETWREEREAEARALEEQRTALLRLQEMVRAEQADITQQREQLYRKLESLPQTLVMSPATREEDQEHRRRDSARYKQPPPGLPLNLLSAQNQVRQPQQVRQQLPLKLATRLSSPPTPLPGAQVLPLKLAAAAPRPAHARTGSSPASVSLASHSPPSPARQAPRTNTYPKIPDRFKIRPDSNKSNNIHNWTN